MSKLTVDYISDMHLSFYLQATSNGYDEKQMTPHNMMHQAQKSMPKIPTVQMPKF